MSSPTVESQFLENLLCGLSVTEVQQVASTDLIPESRLLEFGSYKLYDGQNTYWLDFDQNGLFSLMFADPHPWKKIGLRFSPKLNLCTGEKSYLLKISHPNGYQLLVDGEQPKKYSTGSIEVSDGKHQLQLMNDGNLVAVKEVTLGSSSPGFQWLEMKPSKEQG